uniref:Protein kinase C n=1 Tax=Rodentolepis nana TaxID=102285 RepID=A0A158QGW6_RODNA
LIFTSGSVSPFRARTTLPTDRPVALIRAREPSPKQQTRIPRGQNVTLVYGDRSQSRNGHEKGHRRTKSAAQPTVRVGRDYSPTKINGASKILYATEPETSDYPNVRISRPPYTTESSSPDAYSNHKLPYGFTVDSQLPERHNNNHESSKRNGENGMRFESTRPSGIPYFDYDSDINADTNDNGLRRERNDIYLDDQGRDHQPRIGYQEERMDSPVARNHNGNNSFNFQVGEDVRIAGYTPVNQLISGDLLPSPLIEPLPPKLDEDIDQPKRELNTWHDPTTKAESTYSSHGYEVVRDTDSYSLQQTNLEMPVPSSVTVGNNVSNDGKPLAVTGKEIPSYPPPPSLIPTPPSESPLPYQTPLISKPLQYKMEPKIRHEDQLSNNEQNRVSSFDLLNKVTVPVGSRIQQRIRELSAHLERKEQSSIPKKPLADSGKSKISASSNSQRKDIISEKSQQGEPPVATTKPPSTQFHALPMRVSGKYIDRMDTFIDQKFRAVDSKSSEHLKRIGLPANNQPTSITQKETGVPHYENISRSWRNSNPVSKQFKQNDEKCTLELPSKENMKTSIDESSGLRFIQSIQPGQLIVQRVRELMRGSGETHSIPVNSPNEPAQTKPLIEDFRLVAVLGEGKFGKVFLAEHKRDNTYVALKSFKKIDLLREGNVDTLKVEKRVLLTVSQKKHPCFVHMLAWMQQQHIQRGKFTEQQTVFYAASVVLALEFLHDNNIMYRDLKLENLLLTEKGYLKLLDFGLCKECTGPNDRTNTFCGTPEFVAPEIIIGNGYTRAIDWWCLGVLIYEMIVGKCPFAGASEEVIYKNIMRQEPRIPINVGDKPRDIIKRLMQKSPSKRLGATTGGSAVIKKHPFFANTDFEGILMQRVKPPFVPKIRDIEDVSNFYSRCTETLPRLSTTERSLSPQVNKLYFSDFDF